MNPFELAAHLEDQHDVPQALLLELDAAEARLVHDAEHVRPHYRTPEHTHETFATGGVVLPGRTYTINESDRFC